MICNKLGQYTEKGEITLICRTRVNRGEIIKIYMYRRLEDKLSNVPIQKVNWNHKLYCLVTNKIMNCLVYVAA